MRYIFILISVLLLSSCGTYQISTTNKLKISKVLTITSSGDTVAVPIREFQRYNYDNIRFNSLNNWNTSPYWYGWGYPFYGWNNFGWRYPQFHWQFNDWYYNVPSWNTRTFVRPKVQLPQVPRVRVKGRRGQVTQPNSSLDNVVRRLRRRGVNVNEDNRIRTPRRNQNIRTPRINNNYSPSPRVRPTPPPPRRTPRVQSTPNVQNRTNAGRRNIKQ